MATQKDFDISDEQMEECKARNISCRKVVPNFSSDDEVELIAPSPVFMKFSRPQKKDRSRNGPNNEVYPSTKELLGARSDAANHGKEVAFYSIQKPNLQQDDSFCGSICDSTLPKLNQNDDFDRNKCHRKKKNVIKPSEAGIDSFPDSSLMDKARKYSQKISNKLREEKKAIAKQYFHELLHSCDGGSDEDVEFANSGQKQIHRKKRKAELANNISPCPGKERKEESRCQEKKRHKKKRSKVSPRSCLNGRDITAEAQSPEQDWSCDVLASVPNNERHDCTTSSAGGRISRESNVLRNMVSMDSVDGMQEKPQRRCRQNLCMNIPKELQWPSASESETEEDNADVNIVCSLRHPKPSNYCPSHSYMEDNTSMQLKRKSATCNDSSPRIRRFSSRQCQNLNVVDQNTNSHIPEQMWLYNSANISEGATAIHTVPVRNSSVDAKKKVNTREKGHSQQCKQETSQQSKADLKGVTVISISDDESGSDIIEEESLDSNTRERYPMRRSQRFSDRQDGGWSVPERLENEVLPSPSFLHPSQNPLLAARLTSPDNAGPRASTRSSVKGRPLRPNRNCRQRHEVQSSPRSQRMFQTVAQMDGDEEMARRLQEEMDFEYAMTLHNAEAQVQPPPCHRLPEYHTHDSDSPTTMLTRGMRQATRDMDIVLETLFHEESGESSNENSMMEFSFGPSLMISHNVNRRGNRNRGRRHDWTERLLQDELHQGRNHLPRRILSHNRTFSSNDYEDLLSIAELLGDVKPKGISSEEVTLLPEKKFHPNNKMTSCSICMSDYILNERLKILPCFHEFHGECIEKWIVTNATCPICRVEVKV